MPDPTGLSQPAQAMFDILSAVFAHLDTAYSNVHPGLITIEKLQARAAAIGTETSIWETLKNTPQTLADIYNILQVEYYLVPRPGKTQFISFSIPKYPAVTRSGFIKAELLCYLIELSEGKSETYDILAQSFKSLDIKLPNSSTHHPPLPSKAIMDWYANALVSALHIPLEKIKANHARFIASRSAPPPSNPSPSNSSTSINPPPPNPYPASSSPIPSQTIQGLKNEYAQRELDEQRQFLEQQAEMNRREREAALLGQATRMSEAQMRRNIESSNRMNWM